MKNLVSRFVKDESGATAIEYGLIAAGIAIAIITAVNGVGSKLATNFDNISTEIHLSDGSPWQASHWRQEVPAIGIMEANSA